LEKEKKKTSLFSKAGVSKPALGGPLSCPILLLAGLGAFDWGWS